MGKSADAFRTISEVADWLGVPAHVLRFWESKFTQIKPVKRAGGRRYYRPADMQLLGGIRKLLHDDGMTIKGVQKILREQGVRSVADLAPPFEGDDDIIESGIALDVAQEPDDRGRVLSFGRGPGEDAGRGAAASKPDDEGDYEYEHTEDGGDYALFTPEAAEFQDADLLPEDGDDGADEDRAAAGGTTPEDTEADEAAGMAHTDATAPDSPHRDETGTDVEQIGLEEPAAASGAAATEAEAAPQDESGPSDSGGTPSETALVRRVTPISLPPDPADTIDAGPGALSRLAAVHRPVTPETAERLSALADRLRALRPGRDPLPRAQQSARE